MNIKFGTSGWRAVFADEFTFPNVRKLTHALSGHIKESPEFGHASPDYRREAQGLPASLPPLVVVGYDSRFASPEFAREAAEVLAADGIRVFLSDTELATPALAWAVRREKAVGGIVITASHNPARYNGYKWTPYWGGPATQPVTDDIERRAALIGNVSIAAMSYERAVREGWIKTFDPKPGYLKALSGLFDAKRIKAARLSVGFDALHGTARLLMRPLLEGLGISVTALHEERDVLFGGGSTEPAPQLLGDLIGLMRKKGLDLGLSCDGDADRFGVLDAGGVWIPPNDVLALAMDHLVRNRGMRGKVARSLMTSHFVDAVAKLHGLEIRETPVGFKHIGELLRGGGFILGGEESGGLSIAGHVPEKDGLLAGLLMLELVAFDRKPLVKIREALRKRAGCFFNAREDFHLERVHQVVELTERLKTKPPLQLAGSAVWRIDETDGFKFILKDGSWMGLRPSGTEPVVRLYAESGDADRLKALMSAGAAIVRGKKNG